MEDTIKKMESNGRFVEGHPGGPGRPKGVPNKTTQLAKNVISQAAEQLGGTERLVAWARENQVNERAFWTTIYPKVLPLQIKADIEGNIAVRGALVWKTPS
jgi:hypothetical protein